MISNNNEDEGTDLVPFEDTMDRLLPDTPLPPAPPEAPKTAPAVIEPTPQDEEENEWAMALLHKPEEPKFVLPGLEEGEVAMLVSPGGTGKSWWAWLVAMSVATGIDLLKLNNHGCNIAEPKKVCYISFEDKRIVLKRRTHNAGIAYPILLNPENRKLLKNLKVMNCYHGAFDLMNIDFDPKENAAVGLIDKIEGRTLTIIDTLSQSNSGDENSTKDMAKLVGNLQHLARETNSAIVVLHHTNKGATLNGMGDDASAARGSSTLINNIRCGYFMAGMSEEDAEQCGVSERKRYVRWGTSKTNHIEAVDDVWFERKEGGVLVPTYLNRKNKPQLKKGVKYGNI